MAVRDDAAREKVILRSGRVCEARLKPCTGAATQLHHRQRAGRRDTVDNLMHICASCHEWIHRNPAVSYESGHLVASWDTVAPLPAPAEIPWPSLCSSSSS